MPLPNEAPALAQVAASGLMALHVTGGSIGIVAGTVAMVARKGGRTHRRAGVAFAVSMLAMASLGATIALVSDTARWTNTTAGVFTFYLVATAWAAARRRPGELGRFEKMAAAVPIGLVLMAITLAAVHFGSPRLAGFYTVFAFSALAALAAWGDLKTVRRGGLVGPERTARHLWRMGAAFAIALGSFFIGQQDQLPRLVQGTPWVGLPLAAAVAATLYWQVRTRWPRLRRRVATVAAA